MEFRIVFKILLFPTRIIANNFIKIKLLILILFIINHNPFFACKHSYAYDAGFHETLSQISIDNANNYKKSLFLSGLANNPIDDPIIKGLKPSDWIKHGSSWEDHIQVALATEVDIDLLASALGGWRDFLLHFASQATINLLLSHFYNPLTNQGYSVTIDDLIDKEIYESLIFRSLNDNNSWSYGMARE